MILECSHLTKKFGDRVVLKDVCLSLEAGKIVGLLGRNGQGKSTLIKLICDLLTPTEGSILVDGKPVGPESKAIISYLPERTHLDKSMTVQQVVQLFRDFYADFDFEKAYRLLRDLDLDPEQRLSHMSKGMQEKVQLVLVMSLAHFGGTGVGSPYDLYHHNADSYLSINRLGMATAFRLDVTRLISGQQPQGSIDLQTPTVTMPPLTKPTDPSTDPTESTGGQESTDPSQTEPSTQAPTEPTVDTGPNVLDIDFDTLIAGESNSAIREVHQFFQNREPSNKNEKTGIFEGCNLVMITAEAFSHLVVNEEWTPTLYKMMHEGFYFTDYYVPTWGASTTDGEYCFVTGTYPKSGVWSFAESADNYMPLTMSMQLIDRGYNAYAYHGHTYTYYKRNQYLSNLGYYYRGYGGSTDGKTNGLPIKYTWPESDLEVVDVSTADYVNNAPFTAYYMSISGHMNFAFNENVMSRRNRDYVKDLPYSEAVQAYIACQLEFEFSLQLLMERLEEAGQLENTVFVITADHYPYGLTDENISELLGHEVETNFELFKNACIIYKPGMTPEVIDKPCTHFDILPTLSNMFGLEFDSRLYMGRDVFSDAPGLVVFPNYSWITDYARFNARTGKVENLTDYEVTKEYTDAVMKDMTNRFAVSIRILDYDYWSILFKE